jgi:cellulose biosynthesis protein BcsQ
MSVPVLTFFNNKGGVGKTSLVYHLSWMLSDLGRRVMVCDLDPQANLTAAFLDDDRLAELWDAPDPESAATIFKCVEPLSKVGDLRDPTLQVVTPNLSLLCGDLALSGFEDALSAEWPKSMDSGDRYRPFRILTAFWQVAMAGARRCSADLVLADVGPNLGAINRSALIASDFVVVPLGADLFSLQGMRNLGPTLTRWREDWRRRTENWKPPAFELPTGRMSAIGYVVQQHGVRLSRPVKAYDRWIGRVPQEYRRSILSNPGQANIPDTAYDPFCLATLKHYRSLIPMGQEARKPIFHLTAADGAIGNHAVAAQEARNDFETLARRILGQMGMAPASTPSP